MVFHAPSQPMDNPNYNECLVIRGVSVPTGNGFKDFKISQTAGLQMNSDFITQFQTITKNYNPEVIPGKFKSLLQTHPTVNGVQLQLSLRKRNAVRTDLMKLCKLVKSNAL